MARAREAENEKPWSERTAPKVVSGGDHSTWRSRRPPHGNSGIMELPDQEYSGGHVDSLAQCDRR